MVSKNDALGTESKRRREVAERNRIAGADVAPLRPGEMERQPVAYGEGHDAAMLERGEMVKGTLHVPEELRDMLGESHIVDAEKVHQIKLEHERATECKLRAASVKRMLDAMQYIPSTESAYEKVSHPSHYNWHPSGIECITIVSEFNYNIGSAITYLWRAGRKPGSSTIEDVEKAVFHLSNEISRLQKECDDEETEDQDDNR